jgi:hypothetical protein
MLCLDLRLVIVVEGADVVEGIQNSNVRLEFPDRAELVH